MRLKSNGSLRHFMDVKLFHVLCSEQKSQWTHRQRNRRFPKKQHLFCMHKRRKRVNSASVIWHIVLFRQKNTDRPSDRVLHTSWAYLLNRCQFTMQWIGHFWSWRTSLEGVKVEILLVALPSCSVC